LEDGAEVFKLIGPVLAKQELTDARQNVQKRIDYIGKEIERIESLVADNLKGIEAQKERVERSRTKIRQALQQQGGGGTAGVAVAENVVSTGTATSGGGS
jgi:prefoldin beta subunit